MIKKSKVVKKAVKTVISSTEVEIQLHKDDDSVATEQTVTNVAGVTTVGNATAPP